MSTKCKIHANRSAIGICHGCGDHFCGDCLEEGFEYYYCKSDKCQIKRKKEITTSKKRILEMSKDQPDSAQRILDSAAHIMEEDEGDELILSVQVNNLHLTTGTQALKRIEAAFRMNMSIEGDLLNGIFRIDKNGIGFSSVADDSLITSDSVKIDVPFSDIRSVSYKKGAISNKDRLNKAVGFGIAISSIIFGIAFYKALEKETFDFGNMLYVILGFCVLAIVIIAYNYFTALSRNNSLVVIQYEDNGLLEMLVNDKKLDLILKRMKCDNIEEYND